MSEYFNTAKKLLTEINTLGYDAYIVGGAVRDIFLEVDPHDIDIATNCPCSVLEKNFKCFDIGKSKDFGLVTILYGEFEFEVANFRTETDYTDGRRPDTVNIVDTFEQDSERRDFTFNALAMCENEGVLDYHDGLSDLFSGVLRTVGDPYERFSEDYLRIMRAVRFSVKFGLDIDDNCKKAIIANAPNIHKIAVERVFQEIEKMACMNGDKFATCIELMSELGILKEILPEIERMKAFYHTINHHPEGATVTKI